MNYMNSYTGVIQRFLSSLGVHDVTPSGYWTFVDQWLQWYEGKVSTFHTYKVYNGKREISQTRASMQMAKVCCEDWADLLMNEKVKIMVDDEKCMDILDHVLLDNDFYVQSNQLLEKTFALGEGAFVIYQTSNKDHPVSINYCNAKMIYPLRIVNGQILDCAFCWMLDENVYFCTMHTQNSDGSYTIQNAIFSEGKKHEIEYFQLPKDVLSTYISPIKLFMIIRPNNANNIDIDCNRGVSVFANSIDKLMDIALKFDSYSKEFALGRKRLFVNSDVAQFNVDEKGQMNAVFDSNDIVFYSLSMGENGKPIESVDPTLRVEEHDKALQTSLNIFADSVGFGTNHYTFRDGVTYTNQTQIISSNSKMFRRLKKHEIILEKALIDLTKAVLYLASGSLTDKDISIDFDDSIIEDKAEKQRQALLEYNAGLIDQVQYFMITRNMDESTAQTFVDTIKGRMVQPEDEMDPEDDDEGEVIDHSNPTNEPKTKEDEEGTEEQDPDNEEGE